MTLLVDARPEDLMRAGAFLGASADEMARAGTSCSQAATVHWVGLPSQQYQKQLSSLARELGATRRSFDDACEALLAYGRSLQASSALAQAAGRLERSVVLVPVPGFGVPEPTAAQQAALARAREMRANAEQDELLASGLLIETLHELARRAPHVSSLDRGVSDFVNSLGASIMGAPDLLLSAAKSLPFVGSDSERSDSRKEVKQSVAAMLKPWEQLRDLEREFTSGHAWAASGQLSGALLFRSRGFRGKRFERYGAHDALPASVLVALSRGAKAFDTTALDAEVVVRLQRDFVNALKVLEHYPLPDLDTLLKDGVDLVHHEARGGHTLYMHVGRDEYMLRNRMRWDVEDGNQALARSSFHTLTTAESAVDDVIRANMVAIREWLAEGTQLRSFRAPAPSNAGLVLDVFGRLVSARTVYVGLIRVADGTVRVNTAYLLP